MPLQGLVAKEVERREGNLDGDGLGPRCGPVEDEFDLSKSVLRVLGLLGTQLEQRPG